MRFYSFVLHKTSFWRLVLVLAAAVFFALIPLIFDDPYVLHLMIMGLIWTIVTCSWAVMLGFLGIFHFAQIAFFGIGGYTSALLTIKTGVSPWIGILCGGLLAAAVSLGLSLPSLRLKGPYIAVVSFGFSECIRITSSNLAFTGAELGLWGIPPLWPGCGKTQFYYCILITCMLIVAALYSLVTSKYGIAAKAMKASSVSSESIGIEIYKTKIGFFFFTTFFAGIAGGFYAHFVSGLSPETFSIAHMIDIMVMGLVGGITTIFGPIVGTFIVSIIDRALKGLREPRFRPFTKTF